MSVVVVVVVVFRFSCFLVVLIPLVSHSSVVREKVSRFHSPSFVLDDHVPVHKFAHQAKPERAICPTTLR